MKPNHNLEIIVGDVDDPHLSTATVDSVLIANTYHELTEPESILAHISRALRPGGRLVIVDPGPTTHQSSSGSPEHHVYPEMVEARWRRDGFRIISRDDSFLQLSSEDSWWLIVAAKP